MKTVKKIGKWVGVIILVVGLIGVILYSIYLRPVLRKMEVTHVIPFDSTLTIVEGGGGNSGIFVSDSLVIVIDTKMDEAAKKLADSVKKLAGERPILVINTHFHPDHSGGNQYYEGQTILAGGGYTPEMWKKEAGEKTLPTLWLKNSMTVNMGDDTVTIFTFNKQAHTAGDVFVYLHRRKMLFGGDVILNKQAPAILGAADPDGYTAEFEALQKRYDIRKIVPGHGPIGGIEILKNFQQYFDDMKTAAHDDTKQKEIVAKYKDWTQVPFLMSPDATISAIKKGSEAK